MKTEILSRNHIIIGIITAASLLILKLVSGGAVQQLSAAVEEQTEISDSWEEKCESTKHVVYSLLTENEDCLYVLRGISTEYEEFDEAVEFKYMTPKGGSATWREHDAGMQNSNWISHTLDPKIAFYYATGGCEKTGAIFFKKINHLDLQHEVGYGGEFNEYQIGFKGMSFYNDFIFVTPEMSLDEVRTALKLKGCKTYY